MFNTLRPVGLTHLAGEANREKICSPLETQLEAENRRSVGDYGEADNEIVRSIHSLEDNEEVESIPIHEVHILEEGYRRLRQ